jgi:Ras-related C3 botulinum toxin substrate 1
MGNKAAKIITQALEDPNNEAKLKQVFDSLDKDKSGALKAEEWNKLAELIAKEPTAFGFPQSDTDSIFWMESAFKEADVNLDGKISFSEFHEFCKNHKKIAKENKTTKRYGKGVDGYDYFFKFHVVGTPNAGKTSLLIRAIDNTYKDDYNSEVAKTKYMILNVDGKNVKICVCDLDLHPSLRSKYDTYNESSVVIICYDVNNEESFDHVLSYYGDANSSKIVKLLVGCKEDLGPQRRKVETKKGKEVAEKLRDVTFFECSSLTGTNVSEIFTTAVSQAIKHYPING